MNKYGGNCGMAFITGTMDKLNQLQNLADSLSKLSLEISTYVKNSREKISQFQNQQTEMIAQLEPYRLRKAEITMSSSSSSAPAFPSQQPLAHSTSPVIGAVSNKITQPMVAEGDGYLDYELEEVSVQHANEAAPLKPTSRTGDVTHMVVSQNNSHLMVVRNSQEIELYSTMSLYKAIKSIQLSGDDKLVTVRTIKLLKAGVQSPDFEKDTEEVFLIIGSTSSVGLRLFEISSLTRVRLPTSAAYQRHIELIAINDPTNDIDFCEHLRKTKSTGALLPAFGYMLRVCREFMFLRCDGEILPLEFLCPPKPNSTLPIDLYIDDTERTVCFGADYRRGKSMADIFMYVGSGKLWVGSLVAAVPDEANEVVICGKMMLPVSELNKCSLDGDGFVFMEGQSGILLKGGKLLVSKDQDMYLPHPILDSGLEYEAISITTTNISNLVVVVFKNKRKADLGYIIRVVYDGGDLQKCSELEAATPGFTLAEHEGLLNLYYVQPITFGIATYRFMKKK